jgi:Zn-dependent metalloprotease
VPVFAAILQAHLDTSNQLSAMNGVFIPDVAVDTSPSVNTGQAGEMAIAEVMANPPQNELTGAAQDLSSADLSATQPTLYVYRDGLIQGVSGPNHLVYEIEVTNGSSVRELVYLDAHNGKIINRISLVEDALFRRLFEQNTSTQVWQEGDPFPGDLTEDQQNIVNFSGDSYYHFFNAFGVDSYDGLGSEMQSVNNDPRINCPNANWNGATTNYCNGVTSDDVVAHEWGHAYTQFTHDLIYQWQSGALNESYSDIWGEVVDSSSTSGIERPLMVQ